MGWKRAAAKALLWWCRPGWPAEGELDNCEMKLLAVSRSDCAESLYEY